MNIDIISENTIKLFFNADPFNEKSLQAISLNIAKLIDVLKAEYGSDIIDFIPSYTTLTITVDFPHIYPQSIVTTIENKYRYQLQKRKNNRITTHTLPVYYGKEIALDLERVAEINRLTPEQIIQLHSGKDYQVYAIGFTPGFPYLGFVNPCISTPRLDSPRTHVHAGSVGIAENQTGIYPQSTPGGWNIIGRCPLSLFDNTLGSPPTLHVGDTVRFTPIDRQEFEFLANKLEKDRNLNS